jgi:xanthine dehydrogenase YagR molybdenum-binding subunit
MANGTNGTISTTYLGVPTPRVDGRLKVTGAAKYAGEVRPSDLAYGFVVSATVAKGRIKRIDTRDALAVDGVLEVFSHENRPKLAASDDKYKDDIAPPGSPFRPLYDDKVRFSGQPVALVVAEEFEIARYAATLVRIEYETQEHVTDFLAQAARGGKPNKDYAYEPRGDAAAAFAQAPLQIECEYRMPVEHHNPMETYATTAVWEGNDQITVFDKTQGAPNSRNYLANVLGMPQKKVRVLSPFVGGGFGSGLRPQYQLPLAGMAARALKRSVRLTLTRQQMFTLGYRPANVQKLALGAERDGRLVSFRHEGTGMTSQFEDFQRNLVGWSRQLYGCANSTLGQKLVKLDHNTSCDMRAPGGAEGLYAIECAMDELACAANIDPLELRLINYSEIDQDENKPYSSKELRACYSEGAARFGWARRSHAPRSMRDGKELVGWGMATGIWEAMQLTASARVVLTGNGGVEVASATADIGPGTYTMMTQIAAEMLGIELYNVTAKLGDSDLPHAPVEGGSFTTSSVGSAIAAACREIQTALLGFAQKLPHSPLAGATLDDVVFACGQISRKDDPGRAVSLGDAMRAGDAPRIVREATAEPTKDEKHAHFTHSAVFAEVKIDEEIGLIRVTRVVSAVAAGRILNPVTARSQIIGAVVGGIGMALHEETVTDHAFGRFMNHSLAEYHVPVNADVHDIDVIFVAEKDATINPLGVKGVGEIGIVGTAAAIANAVYHATGRRVRELPITLDKVME